MLEKRKPFSLFLSLALSSSRRTTSHPKIRRRDRGSRAWLSDEFFRALARERAELFDLTSPRAVTDELAEIQSLECFLEHLVAIVLTWKQSQ